MISCVGLPPTTGHHFADFDPFGNSTAANHLSRVMTSRAMSSLARLHVQHQGYYMIHFNMLNII